MTTLESEIKSIIEEVICGKYIGKLKVVKEEVDKNILWMLLLYLNMELSPMILAYEGTEEQSPWQRKSHPFQKQRIQGPLH